MTYYKPTLEDKAYGERQSELMYKMRYDPIFIRDNTIRLTLIVGTIMVIIIASMMIPTREHIMGEGTSKIDWVWRASLGGFCVLVMIATMQWFLVPKWTRQKLARLGAYCSRTIPGNATKKEVAACVDRELDKEDMRRIPP